MILVMPSALSRSVSRSTFASLVRGLLAEFGVVLPQAPTRVEALPGCAKTVIDDRINDRL